LPRAFEPVNGLAESRKILEIARIDLRFLNKAELAVVLDDHAQHAGARTFCPVVLFSTKARDSA
jgi:hypothetical protein